MPLSPALPLSFYSYSYYYYSYYYYSYYYYYYYSFSSVDSISVGQKHSKTLVRRVFPSDV